MELGMVKQVVQQIKDMQSLPFAGRTRSAAAGLLRVIERPRQSNEIFGQTAHPIR